MATTVKKTKKSAAKAKAKEQLKLVTFDYYDFKEMETTTVKEVITESKRQEYLETLSHCGVYTTRYNDDDEECMEFSSDDFVKALEEAEDISADEVQVLRKHKMLNSFLEEEIEEFVEKQKEINEGNEVDWDGNPIQTWEYYPIKISRGDKWWTAEAENEEECKREIAKLIKSGKYLKGELAYCLSNSDMEEVIV